MAMLCTMIEKVIGFRKHMRCGDEACATLSHILKALNISKLELTNSLVLMNQRRIGSTNKP